MVVHAAVWSLYVSGFTQMRTLCGTRDMVEHGLTISRMTIICIIRILNIRMCAIFWCSLSLVKCVYVCVCAVCRLLAMTSFQIHIHTI